MHITLTFRLTQDTLPTELEQLQDLWKVALLLTPLGLPLDDWYPPADTPEDSIRNLAFDKDGPTSAALAILHAQKQEKELPGLRMFGVWNGRNRDGGVAIDSTLTVMPSNRICTFRLLSKLVPALSDKEKILSLIHGLLDIWPASMIEIGPLKYFTMQQVFPKRPGVGWMLYLPSVLTTKEVPEAQALVPVMNDNKTQRGTIIVSVTDEPFSTENKEHVKIANAIEIRLVDQDLMPLYADLGV
jgi:hypothetical protein